MKHRIVVLGAGYAGAFSAGNMARRLNPADTEITVVSADPYFVERTRLHQLASGQDLRMVPLADMFAGTGVRVRVARVQALDVERRTVTLDDGELSYDTLLYALGSTVADHGVPGVAEHAFHVCDRAAALRLRERLDGLGEGAHVLVVGEGLTGIETVTEIAESHPGLNVALAARGEPGDRLSPGARRHLRRAFERFGITVHDHTVIERVEPTRAVAADGTVLPADVTVWAGGFAVQPIAGDSGLKVAETGQIIVDRDMRSVSHPDGYAAGDSAFVIGVNGRPLPMTCFTAGVTGMQATNAIVGRLTGRRVRPAPLVYFGNHISLGRRDAIWQFVDRDLRAYSWSLRSRPGAWLKDLVLRSAAWNMRHPTFGLPARRRRLAAGRDRSAEAALV